MVEEFACPHCGKNLGPSLSPPHATLMCPYCRQFFTMAAGPEFSPPQDQPFPPLPPKIKAPERAPSKIDRPESPAGKSPPPAAPTQPTPPVVPPSAKPDSLSALSADTPSRSPSSSFQPGVIDIEAEKISAVRAPFSRPPGGSAVSPYIIPEVPRKTGSSLVGISVMIIGGLCFLASLLLAIILADNYSDFAPLAEYFPPVIKQMDKMQTTLMDKFPMAFIGSFPFEMIVAGCFVLISLVLLWSGDGIRRKKKSALVVLTLLIAIVSVTAILIGMLISPAAPPPPADTGF